MRIQIRHEDWIATLTPDKKKPYLYTCIINHENKYVTGGQAYLQRRNWNNRYEWVRGDLSFQLKHPEKIPLELNRKIKAVWDEIWKVQELLA